MHPDGCSERDAGHVRALDADRAQETRELICIGRRRARLLRLVALSRSGRSTAMQVKCSVYAGSWNA
jgi:hypothetical protein